MSAVVCLVVVCGHRPRAPANDTHNLKTIPYDLVPPTIDRTHLQLSRTVIANKSLSLECPVFGIPTPDVIWYKNTQPIDVIRDAHLYEDEQGQRLVIMSATTDDTGTYECKAINDAGSDTITYQLSVLGNNNIQGSIIKS